jgi:hydroxymethylbilane synthase
MKSLTVATRRGDLALVQTQSVIAALRERHPGLDVRIKEITSEGDRDRRTVLWELKDAGFFTSRLEEALLAGEADFAVHSFKDLPTKARGGLTVAAVLDRRFAEDCVLARGAVGSLAELPPAARVGTSSLRRIAQLGHFRPELRPVPIRGNVQTRVDKLAGGELDAVVLARAGLERLGLADRTSFTFDPEQFVPAAAQGALAVQARSDDAKTSEILRAIDDNGARTLTSAERQVLITMKCGCHAPVGAHARRQGDDLVLTAFVADRSGATYVKRQIAGPTAEAETLGRDVAGQLLAAGGEAILAQLEKERDQGDQKT